MDIKDFIINNYFLPKIKDRKCLVIYDNWKYKDLLKKINDKKIKIIDTTISDLNSRKLSFESLKKLSKKKSEITGLIIYLPFRRPTDKERLKNPYTIYELFGDYFPRHDSDEYINICKSFKPDEISQINEIFENSAELPDFDIINRIGGNQVWPILSHVLKAESNLEIMKSFLTPNEDQVEKLNANLDWKEECKLFFKQNLEIDISDFKDIQDLSDQIWQLVLFTEFVYDLPENGPGVPSELNNIPKINKNKIHFIQRICDDLRNDTKIQELYIEKSVNIEDKLKLKSFFKNFDDLGVRDTFAFEDKTFLIKSINLLKQNKFHEVKEILTQRRNSIWFKLGDDTPLEWNLVNICLNLLQKLEDLEKSFIKYANDLNAIIDFYKKEFFIVDKLIREFISTKNDIFSEKFEELIKITIDRYCSLSEKLQKKFITRIENNKWPPQDFKSNFTAFDDHVFPLFSDKKSKVVYFMIDALRYELGIELKNFLENENLQLKINSLFSPLPSITNIGMASLLPDAQNEIKLSLESNHLNVFYADKNINDASNRMNVFKNKFGDQFKQINLDQISSNLKKQIEKNIKLLVVRSYSMDKLLETNDDSALNTIFNTFKKIKYTLNILSEIGFTNAFIVSDHGFLFNLYRDDRGNVIQKPDGNWVELHDRCLVGSGTEDDNNLAFLSEDLSLTGFDSKLIFPKSIYPYKKNKFYLHGGLSIQETLVPLLTIELSNPKNTHKKDFEVKLSYRDGKTNKITTRNPILNIEVSSLDLVSQAEEEEIELIIDVFDNNNNIVGGIKPNIDVPDYKMLRVLYGEKRKITLKLDDNYEGDVIIKAINPNNEIVLDELKLKTEYLL